MPCTNLHDVQVVASATLREAMENERSKRYTKVVQNYRRLVRMLNKENLPPNFDPPSWFTMLMYEIHYHLGLALQQVGEHKKAVTQYSKAIDAVFIPKGGCMAGCNTNSCLMTPLYTRRAFAAGIAGDLKGALRDAEKAVVLDSRNPDVYCVRALVRSTRQEEKEALKDVGLALKFNPNHLCALILRGTLAEPLIIDDWLDPGARRSNVDHEKRHIHGVCKSEACNINPDCHNFLNVKNLKHDDILGFYDRFLYSLGLPHTISTIHFVAAPQRPPSKSILKQGSVTTERPLSTKPPLPKDPSDGRTSAYSTNTMRTIVVNNMWTEEGVRAFRCGTPVERASAPTSQRRRKEYGEALREHMAKPTSASEYIVYLEKQRQQQDLKEYQMSKANRSKSRPQTATITRPRVPSAALARSRSEGNVYRPRSASSRLNDAIPYRNSDIVDVNNTLGNRDRDSMYASQTVYSERSVSSIQQKKNDKIPVFQIVNLKEAPRMYYRPWSGDKLPVADIERKQHITPPFRV